MKIKQVASSLIHGPSAMRPVTWVPSTYLAKGLLVVIITCVTLVMGKRMGLTIVGTTETDSINHRISNESPAGMALIGHVVGDQVSFNTPTGKVREYKIVNITR